MGKYKNKRMGEHLFIVFTPLQLFVAQQIIRQEGLKDCVLVEGYRTLFADAYDIMRIDDLWSVKYDILKIAVMESPRMNTLEKANVARENFKQVDAIIKKHGIGTVYVGEVLNNACRFAAVIYAKRGLKVCFFEEGTSHYIDRPYTQDESLSHKIKIHLYDWFYYLPLYGIRFGRWITEANCPYDALPMHKRYSIIPFHNKPFDVRLEVKPMFSKRLEEYVKSNMCDADGTHRVMLMTDPLRELMPNEYLYLYFDVIRECIEGLDDDVCLYIKFHPREIETSRNKILDIAQASGKRFKVLSEEVNICVEYYLQMFRFEQIYFFNAATYFYNGYAFPKTEFVKLMPRVYEKCKAAGIKDLRYMENMLKMIEAPDFASSKE